PTWFYRGCGGSNGLASDHLSPGAAFVVHFTNLVAIASALTGGSGSRYADAMARRDLIAEKLTKAFAPASLEVVDESHQHAGHAGHREGGEPHFRVYLVVEAIRGKSRLEAKRMLNHPRQ